MLLRDTHSHWQVKQIRHVTAGFKQSFNLSASTVRNTLAVLCNSKLLPFQAKHFPRREYWHLVKLLKETHPGLTHVYTLQLKMYIGFPREESCILLVLGWSLWLIFSDVVMFSRSIIEILLWLLTWYVSMSCCSKYSCIKDQSKQTDILLN